MGSFSLKTGLVGVCFCLQAIMAWHECRQMADTIASQRRMGMRDWELGELNGMQTLRQWQMPGGYG